MRIVVTGASGFIGSRVADALAAREDEVTAFDRVEGSGKRKTVLGEITEWQHVAQLLKDAQPDAVIHCAAIVGVLNSVDAPFATIRVNIGGALNLLESMRLFGVKRLINLSTEEIYGHFRAERIDEDHPCEPVAPYGISKLAVEHLSRDYRRNHGIDTIHLRTCWVYGPGLPLPRVPKTLVEAAVQGKPLHVASGGDFRVDHVYIDDLVQGVLAALDKKEHRYDAYHISSGAAPTLAEIVDIVNELVPGARISIGPGAYRFGDRIESVRKGVLLHERATREFGYQPRYGIRAGIGAYIEHQRKM